MTDTTSDVRAGHLSRLPSMVSSALADHDSVDDLLRRWRNTSTLLVVSRGPSCAAAAEIALKVRDTAAVFAQGMSTADLLHGPIASVRPDVPVLILGARGALDDDVAGVVERRRLAGADVEVWPAAEASITGDDLSSDVMSAIVATVRGQQLAHGLARANGADPDEPSGLTKVTLTR